MDWQPIETAPKDGPFNGGTVLLYGPEMNVGIGWWCDDGGHWINDCYVDYANECYPTHWMPLPEPPTP